MASFDASLDTQLHHSRIKTEQQRPTTTMDFDVAARRLKADQQSSLARNRASRNARTAGAKARREAAAARRRAEERLIARRAEVERHARVVDGVAR